jgi:hypothetical protein
MKKMFLLLITLFFMISLIFASPNDPVPFGNLTDDTVFIGGSEGIINGTGNLIIDVNTLFVDSINDRVGIGTSNPNNTLHVTGNVSVNDNLYVGETNNFNAEFSNAFITKNTDANNAFSARTYSDNDNRRNAFTFNRYGGNESNPTVLPSNAQIFAINMNAYDGDSNELVAQILGQAETVGGDENISAFISFSTRGLNDGGGAIERMRITGDGDIGIGDTSPSVKLDVEGGISSKALYQSKRNSSFTVSGASTWDFVQMNVTEFIDTDYFTENVPGNVSIDVIGVYEICVDCQSYLSSGTRDFGACAAFKNGAQLPRVTAGGQYGRLTTTIGSTNQMCWRETLAVDDEITYHYWSDAGLLQLGGDPDSIYTEPAGISIEYVRDTE